MRIEGGRFIETIDGVEIPWPKTPPADQIEGGQYPTEEQYFRRTPEPLFMSEVELDDFGNRVYDERQWAFIMRELRRMFSDGYWFFNNGRPTYITPFHYFYLNHARFEDRSRPEYREMARKKHLFFDHFYHDEVTFGIINMKKRRDGATTEENARCLWMAYTHIGGHVGIQSLDRDSAKKNNFEGVVRIWRGLPDWLKPLHDGTDNPKTELRFSKPAEQRGKRNPVLAKSEAIDSKITFESAGVTAYDGQKLVYYLQDEIGKTTEVDVGERWDKIRLCLSTGGEIEKVGFSMGISTVEEMTKKGGENFRRMWDLSDPKLLNKFGYTPSRMRQLFFPAYEGLQDFIGKYGEDIIDPPQGDQKKYIEEKFKAKPTKRDQVLMGSRAYLDGRVEEARSAPNAQNLLATLKRTYPRDRQEAFLAASGSSGFNIDLLDAAERAIYSEEVVKPVCGELVWEGGIRDSRVIFVPNGQGPFEFWWNFKSEGDASNKVDIVTTRQESVNGEHRTRNIYRPGTNSQRFIIGMDPYEVDQTRFGQGSDGAMYVYMKPDMLLPQQEKQFEDSFVCRYLYRRPTAKEFFEDIIKLAVYFGCQIFGEDKNRGWLNHVHERGYTSFLLPTLRDAAGKVFDQPKVELSVAASKSTNIQIAEAWQWYIETNWQKLRDLKLIQQLKAFDVNHTEPSDAVMASGYALVAKERITRMTIGNRGSEKAAPLFGAEKEATFDTYERLK